MIQRIQSIYLLLGGGILASLFASFMDFGKMKGNEAVPGSKELSDGVLNLADSDVTMIGVFAALTLFLVAIFLYKNRLMQTRVVAVAMLCTLLVFAVAAWLYYTNSQVQGEKLEPGLGMASPVFAIFFGWLANKSIRKDDALVKSMDRLR